MNAAKGRDCRGWWYALLSEDGRVVWSETMAYSAVVPREVAEAVITLFRKGSEDTDYSLAAYDKDDRNRAIFFADYKAPNEEAAKLYAELRYAREG